MSYSDYNYQQSSTLEAGAGFDSTYAQGSYDASQYGSYDQYSVDKTSQPQYANQYDYSYTENYQQPADTTTPVDYYSSNDYGLNAVSYSQENIAPLPSTGYDATSGYSQTPAYQYSNSAEQSATIPTTSQNYSFQNTAFDTSSATYEYSDPTSYTNLAAAQYEQSGYSYNPNSTSYSDTTSFENQDYNTLLSNSSFSSPYSKSNQPSHVSPNGGNLAFQSQDNNFGIQNTQLGGYQNTPSSSGAGGYQSTQSGAGEYQSTHSISGGGYQNAQSGLGGYDKTQSRIGGFQSTPSGAYNNTQSDGFQNSPTGYYSSPFDSTRQDLNNKGDDPLDGYSFATKKEYGSYSQSSGSGFSSRTGSSNFSQSGGKNFSQSGGNNFSHSGGNNFSPSGGNNFSQSGGNSFSSSRGNGFSNSGGNNFSFSGGSNYSQQGPRGRNNFNQRRDDSGLPITARNMGNNQMGTNMNNDNTRSYNSGSWRGSSRGGGGGNYSQNRGGFNDVKNDMPNRSSSRGGKFDNNFGPRDHRGNQFQPRNSGDQDRARRPLFNRGTWPDAGNNKRETSSTKTTPQSDSAYHTNIVNKSPKGKSKEEGKAPFYPNQKLLNEVEGKKENVKQEEVKVSDAKPTEDVVKKDSNLKATDGQKEKTQTNEAKSKSAEQKVLAPPTKAPETPEEIALEEEIQRKIRESIVVVNPDNEKSLLSDDPMKVVEMSTELRDLLKTLTTEHFCKLCTLRMVGPQMATMHYNGKNHLKKVRIFIQTNGRSAGYNMDTMNTEDSSDKPKVDNESTEVTVTEETELDEKKYCKICKISFSQESQSEMHYKGKNHAKKLRSVTNGSELFECKVCCVTVTAQEHLTAHLNGSRHKLQIRKMEGDNAHRGGLRGRGGYRGKGGRGGMSGSAEGDEDQSQGQTGFRGRGRGRGQNWRGGFDRGGKLIIKDEKDEELYNLLGLTPEKRYKFDLANFRTPSGKFYCSSCDLVMEEEPRFLLHLGNRKHQEKVYKSKPKGERTCLKIKVEREPFMFSRTQ